MCDAIMLVQDDRQDSRWPLLFGRDIVGAGEAEAAEYAAAWHGVGGPQ